MVATDADLVGMVELTGAASAQLEASKREKRAKIMFD